MRNDGRLAGRLVLAVRRSNCSEARSVRYSKNAVSRTVADYREWFWVRTPEIAAAWNFECTLSRVRTRASDCEPIVGQSDVAPLKGLPPACKSEIRVASSLPVLLRRSGAFGFRSSRRETNVGKLAGAIAQRIREDAVALAGAPLQHPDRPELKPLLLGAR